ncbi:MAG: hypothetical protein CVU89_00415 [Firmicutes bacterium HGW-Firmicutes-14]|nr:MAG: hypothetical protein CVU89_00415 [Firmicutes bacterium HGW-Firmicutes-14]
MHELTWPIIIAIYLFVAGDGVAAFYSGILAYSFGKENYAKVARIGAYLGVPLILFGLLMLIIDLGRPLSFWHFIIGDNFLPIFRPSSTMSLGTWLLTAFVILGGLYALTWLAEEQFAKKLPFIRAFANKPVLRKNLGLATLPFAFLIACYTGILLSSTSAPLWNSTPYLGLLFLMSATSTGLSCIILILAAKKAEHCLIYRLSMADAIVDIMELIVFVMLIVRLSSTAPEAAVLLLKGEYSTLFWLGIVVMGLVVPLVLEIYELTAKKINIINTKVPVVSAVLILVGGFLTRVVILYAGQATKLVNY